MTDVEGFSQIRDGGTENLGGGGGGHGHMVWEPLEGVGVHNLVGAPSDAGVATVALKVRAHIPAVNAGGRPGAALVGLLVNDNVGARGGNGMGVVVIVAVELGPGRKLGVEAGSAKEIEGELSLGQQETPIVKGEVRVTAAKDGNEVVLEGLDGTFSGVAAVDVGRSELVVNVFLFEVVLENGGALIVKVLEFRAATGADELIVPLLVGGKDGFSFAVLEGFNSNVVGVIFIEDKQVAIAFARREREASSEITVAPARGGAVNDGGKEGVCPFAGLDRRGKETGFIKKRESDLGRLGGLKVLADLLHVGLGSGHRIRGVLAERVEGEAREGGKGIGGLE